MKYSARFEVRIKNEDWLRVRSNSESFEVAISWCLITPVPFPTGLRQLSWFTTKSGNHRHSDQSNSAGTID
jgi:hypothetical protein